jgi:hypothetical protein
LKVPTAHSKKCSPNSRRNLYDRCPAMRELIKKGLRRITSLPMPLRRIKTAWQSRELVASLRSRWQTAFERLERTGIQRSLLLSLANVLSVLRTRLDHLLDLCRRQIFSSLINVSLVLRTRLRRRLLLLDLRRRQTFPGGWTWM